MIVVVFVVVVVVAWFDDGCGGVMVMYWWLCRSAGDGCDGGCRRRGGDEVRKILKSEK